MSARKLRLESRNGVENYSYDDTVENVKKKTRSIQTYDVKL